MCDAALFSLKSPVFAGSEGLDTKIRCPLLFNITKNAPAFFYYIAICTRKGNAKSEMKTEKVR